jgi:hypothetical protein
VPDSRHSRPSCSSCPPRRRRTAAAVVGAVAVLVSAVAVVAPAAAQHDRPYVPPVEAPVVDPFRPPDRPWGPGNRGLTYDLEPDTPVRAVGDGEVTFAGPVAGTLHVTVLHPDGIRTSYSFLSEVGVGIGQRVGQGEPVGRAGAGFHLGARIGDAYFDPATLFGDGPVRVQLIPFDAPLPPGVMGERSALRSLMGGAGRLAAGAGRLAGGAAGYVAGELADGAGFVTHYVTSLHPVPVGMRVAVTAHQAWVASQRQCTAPDVAVPDHPERRVAILVAGLNSSGEGDAIDRLDTAAIGYQPGDVLRFSYAGGRVPDPTDAVDAGSARPYEPADTLHDIRSRGALLADLVEEAVAAAPGAEIDLLAHSQGGLVARQALIELERRHGPEWLEQVGVLVTLGTPHGGADLATGASLLRATWGGRVAFALAGEVLPIDGGATSVRQLAETSDFVAELNRTPLPAAVPVTSIAARGDLVVPVPRSRLGGATNVTVSLAGPTAHGALPGSPAASREVALAVAGLPPGCTAFGRALFDGLAGEAISSAEDALAVAAWTTLAPTGPAG